MLAQLEARGFRNLAPLEVGFDGGGDELDEGLEQGALIDGCRVEPVVFGNLTALSVGC